MPPKCCSGGRRVVPDDRVHAAQADAWQAQGRLRERCGGGAVAVPGARLMSSGLPHPQWNSGFVEDIGRFDIEAVRAWYAARAFGAGVPWGLLVPQALPFAHGRLLHVKRCMGLAAGDFLPAGAPASVVFAAANMEDTDRVVLIDAEVFGEPVESDRCWIAPQIGADGFTVAIARRDGEPVGTAIALETHGRAGPCVGIFGVAVLEHARRRGVGAALTTWLLARAFAGGATLAHLNPDTDVAARLYARLGFVETAGFDIYLDVIGGMQ